MIDVISNPDCTGDGQEETDPTISKEEEERYRKLLQENEQLQQLIAARENKLKLLNQRLVERNSSSNLNGATAANAPQATIHPAPVKKNRFKLSLF